MSDQKHGQYHNDDQGYGASGNAGEHPRVSARARGIAEADRAREELYETLSQLRDRLDYAQRIDNRVAQVKRRIAEEKRDNPLGFGIGVAAAAVACGAAVWAITEKVMRAFD